MKRGLSPIWFVLIVGAFFLPFVSISCSTEGLGDVAGDLGGQVPAGGFEVSVKTLDFVIGGEASVSGSQEFLDEIQAQSGQEGTDEVETEIYAQVAAGLAVLGIFLSLIAGRLGAIMSIILGAGVTLSIILLKPAVNEQLQISDVPSGFGVSITYGLGYWGPLVLGLVAAAWGVLRLLAPDGGRAAGMPAAPTAPPTTTAMPGGGTGFESTGTPPPPAPPGGGPGTAPEEPPPPA